MMSSIWHVSTLPSFWLCSIFQTSRFDNSTPNTNGYLTLALSFFPSTQFPFAILFDVYQTSRILLPWPIAPATHVTLCTHCVELNLCTHRVWGLSPPPPSPPHRFVSSTTALQSVPPPPPRRLCQTGLRQYVKSVCKGVVMGSVLCVPVQRGAGKLSWTDKDGWGLAQSSCGVSEDAKRIEVQIGLEVWLSGTAARKKCWTIPRRQVPETQST